METGTGDRKTSCSTNYQETKPIHCRTEGFANAPEADEVRSSCVCHSMTNCYVGIVSLQAVSEVKAIRRLGGSTSSDRTYTAATFRSTALIFRRLKLTRTRSSCSQMDRTGTEEAIPARNRSCQRTNSSPCRTEEAANPQEVDEVRSSYARRSMTKLSGDIVYQWVVWEAKAVHRQGDNISSHRTYTDAIIRLPYPLFKE